MRIFCAALFVFFQASLFSAQQPAVNGAGFSGKLSIPAQLVHTVRADKAHPGDPVEFNTLSAVLVGHGLVMPADAHLYGRVLGAAPKQENKNSYLLLVVERAEWKEHSLPLHAFVAAQIAVKTKSLTTNSDAPPPASSSRRSARMSGRIAAANDPSLSGMVRTPQDATETEPPPPVSSHPMLDGVGIFRDKNGTTYLLSATSNVTLPAGVLLLLRDEPVDAVNSAARKPATGNQP